MTGDWLATTRAEVGAERILAAAAELFVEHGVESVGMGQIATQAGCSRATLYRYFPTRDDLHLAYMHRTARQVAAQVGADLDELASTPGDARELVAEAILCSIDRVRRTPTLATWFRADDAQVGVTLAARSEIISSLAGSVVDDADTARWMVRVILSYLVSPDDPASERAQVERFAVAGIGATRTPTPHDRTARR